MPGCVRQPEGLAGAVLGRLALGAVPCQQAARGIRRAAYARHPRQLRRHPPAPDIHHLPPLLRADARFRRAGRVPVRGSDASCAILLSGAAVLPRHALLQGQADGQVIIRKVSPAADVLINGVRLGAEPTPLLHGDKVEVGGHELTFVDERRSGSTQFVKAFTPATAAGPPKASAKPPGIGVTGGRVVSLTDGREYVIAAASLVFGREAGCDVVVAGKDVSRRHAEIVQTPKGYLLVDTSTNGTFVNEERVEGQRILARTDVIRLGDEQFRFYVDAAPATAAPPPPPGPAEIGRAHV